MRIERYLGIDRETARHMIAATHRMTSEKSGYNDFQSTSVFRFDDHVVLRMRNITYRNVDTHDPDLRHLQRLSETLLALRNQGIHVIPILAFQGDDEDGYGYIVQPRARGAELYDRDRLHDRAYILRRVASLSRAPQAHYDAFIADAMAIIDAGVLIDFLGKDNFFYDTSIGFQFIDLNAHLDCEYGLSDTRPQPARVLAWNGFLPCYYDTAPAYRDTVSGIWSGLTDEERIQLQAGNRSIFDRCKSAMMRSGIAEAWIDEAVHSEDFMPQRRRMALV